MAKVQLHYAISITQFEGEEPIATAVVRVGDDMWYGINGLKSPDDLNDDVAIAAYHEYFDNKTMLPATSSWGFFMMPFVLKTTIVKTDAFIELRERSNHVQSVASNADTPVK